MLVAPHLKHEFLGLPTRPNERNSWAFWVDDDILQAQGDQVFILSGPGPQGRLYSLKSIQQSLWLKLKLKIQPFCVPVDLNLELKLPAKL